MRYIEDLELDILRGKHIINAEINESRDLIKLTTDQGIFYLTWEGECCASCFIAEVSGSSNLVGSTITGIENTAWKRKESDDEVVETMGTNITTTKGYVGISTRTEHNGYYGGSILVSDEAPLNQYHSPRYNEKYKQPALKPLEDF